MLFILSLRSTIPTSIFRIIKDIFTCAPEENFCLRSLKESRNFLIECSNRQFRNDCVVLKLYHRIICRNEDCAQVVHDLKHMVLCDVSRGSDVKCCSPQKSKMKLIFLVALMIPMNIVDAYYVDACFPSHRQQCDAKAL